MHGDAVGGALEPQLDTLARAERVDQLACYRHLSGIPFSCPHDFIIVNWRPVAAALPVPLSICALVHMVEE
jgi:hypothetical protein